MADVGRVLICGYYGFGNAGDEAILSVLLDDVRSLYPQATIAVVSGDSEGTAIRHQVEGVAWASPAALIEAARQSDLMILGGGGLIQDYNGFDASALLGPEHGNVIWAEFAMLARMWSKPLAIYAIGVGPLTSEEGRRAARLTFDLATTATVRDERSARLLAEIGVPPAKIEVTADPVFRLRPGVADATVLEAEGVPTGDFTIGVCLRPWHGGLPIKELAAALDVMVEKYDSRIAFLPFQLASARNENDSHAAHEVMLAMRNADRAGIIRGAYGPREKLALFTHFDVVIAMRLHAAMFGVQAGKPTVAISYDPKVDSLMEDYGLGEFVIPLNDLGTDVLIGAVEKAIETGVTDDTRGRLADFAGRAERSRAAIAAAAENFRAAGDSEVLELLGTAALARSDLMTALDRTRNDLEIAQTVNDQLRGELDEVHGSRAQRLARQYWRARQTTKDVASSLTRAVAKREAPQIISAPERFADSSEYGGSAELRALYTRQLTRILKENPHAVGYAVVPFSIGWYTSLFQRPQQMALALARQGYLVFYGLDHYAREQTDGFRWIAPNVYLYSMFPQYLDVLKGIRRPLTLTYAYNFRLARHLADPVIVFEHIDELEVFTSTHPMDHLVQWYDDAINRADIVVASAHDLLATVRKRRPDAFLCQNGVDFDHFHGRRAGPPPDDLAPLVATGRPIVGYYGAMAEWLDYELLDHAAEQLREYEFVFIGPNYDRSMDEAAVFRRPNVHWLGAKTYDELPRYLQGFTIATVPFVLNEVTHAVSPVKVNEYLAAGKPVVTTATREALHNPVLLVAASPAEWVEKIREGASLAVDQGFVERLVTSARANTWDQRVGLLIDTAARLHKL